MRVLKKRIKPEDQSLQKKIKNVQKHLRIAKAAKGIESQTHVEKAGKLIEKYGFK